MIGVIADSYVSGDTYYSSVISDGPAGYWRLSDATTQDSYSAHDPALTGGGLTPSGGIQVSGPFAGAKAHRLVQSGSLTGTSAMSGFSKMTLEAWIRTTANSGQILSCRADSSGSVSFTIAFGPAPVGGGGNGRLWFGADGSAIFVGATSTATINDGNWHHIAAVWNGTSGVAYSPSQTTIYIDGAVAAQSGATTQGSKAAPLGGAAWWSSFSGDVSRIAMFKNVALSASQIANHYTNKDSAVLADNPTVFWTMDELLKNSYLYEQVFGRSGSYVGTVTKQADGLLPGSSDKAISLSGSGYAKIPVDTSWMVPSSFTVECIAKQSASGVGLMMSRYEASAADWRLLVDSDGSVIFSIYNGSGFVDLRAPAGTMVAGNRYHVAATFNGSTGARAIYVNGVSKATGSAGRSVYNSPAMFIGTEYNGSGNFNGTLDEAAFYGKVLAFDRILAHAKAAGF